MQDNPFGARPANLDDDIDEGAEFDEADETEPQQDASYDEDNGVYRSGNNKYKAPKAKKKAVAKIVKKTKQKQARKAKRK